MLAEYLSLVEILQQRASDPSEDLAGYTFLRAGEDESESLTFSQLNARARAVAAMLDEAGTRGERVLLLYPPGLDFLVGFFGCLYSCSIAVPAYPPRSQRGLPRLFAVMRDARPILVLTCSSLHGKIRRLMDDTPGLDGTRLVATDELSPDYLSPEVVASQGKEMPSPDTVAFLQYTSGSTSSPKGVMISHRNLLDNEERIRRSFGQSQKSVIVSWLPIYHDMGLIGGMLQPLYLGARCLFMSPTAFLQRPALWLETISKYRATTSGGPNFAYELCVDRIGLQAREQLNLSTWSVAFNGSEPVRYSTLERFVRAFAPCGFRREAFYPCYGLAETTLFATGGSVMSAPTVTSVDSKALRKGRWVHNTDRGAELSWQVGCGVAGPGHEVAIVDPEVRSRLPADHVGEIWISGPSVAQGYWQQPGATRHSFQARIEGEPESGRFLRTGDLGVLKVGELFVTGRLKDLIVIRGRNYYPQDLELTVEQSHSNLRTGCGAAFSIDVASGERVVIVHEVARHVTDEPEAIIEAIRTAVAEEHEVRVHEVVLLRPATIPKTSSGKIQRQACRAQYSSGELTVFHRSAVGMSPASIINDSVLAGETRGESTGVEDLPSEADGAVAATLSRAQLSELSMSERYQCLETWLRYQFAHLVGGDASDVDSEKPLIGLGLDSLIALEVTHGVESSLGVRLPFSLMMQGASVSELVHEILGQLAANETPPGVTPTGAGESRAVYTASHGQRSLWFLYRLAPESAAYVIAGAARIRGGLNEEALKRSFRHLVRRHPALRTSFSQAGDGEPQARVNEAVECELVVEEVAGHGPESLARRLETQAYRPFDLEASSLLRLRLYRLPDDQHVLLLAIHHIVADFWSLAVLASELEALYQSETESSPAALEPLPVTYADYARWQSRMMSGPEGERLWRYWQARLPGEPTELPTDRPRPKLQTFRGASRVLHLSRVVTTDLKATATTCGTTLYATLLTTFFALIHRYTGQRDLTVGSPTAGRSSAGLAGLVGYFANPLVIRVDWAGDSPFEANLKRTSKTVSSAFEHQDMPFSLLAKRLLRQHDPSRSSLFQIQFIWQQDRPQRQGLAGFSLGQGGISMELGGLELESVELHSKSAQFDCSLSLAEVGGCLVASLQYNTDLFDSTTAERQLKHFDHLLSGISRAPTERLDELPMLSRAECQQSLVEWNPTTADRHVPTLHQLFEVQAVRVSERVAVVFREQRTTYGYLDKSANRLAHRLQALGVGPEVPVGICLERSPDMVMGMLGVLKAGGAYVPLDLQYPRQRLLLMLEDCRTRFLLVDRQPPANLPWQGMTTIAVTELGSERTGDDIGKAPPVRAGGADHLAYLIYTSGSTGRPKGVAIEHRAAVRFLQWAGEIFSARDLTGTLAATSICFDLSVFELFLPLTVGGSVIMMGNALEMLNSPISSEVTLVNTVPSVMAELVAGGALRRSASVRTVNLAGEALPRRLVEQIHEQTPASRVFNLYGPSEDTTYSIFAEISGGEATPPAIGRPVAGSQAYLADRHLRPVPVGVAAEILLAGAGLARGYFRSPGATARCFVPDPVSARAGNRLYRTGDLGCWRTDGLLDFLGRIDRQVKIRGFRIELGEIEQFLLRYPGLREVVVLACESPVGDRQLVAYAVAGAESSPTADDLRNFLADQVPHFMVPERFVFLDSLPRTPNGKLNRQALPLEPGRSQRKTSFVAPRTPVEKMVAAIWSEVLGSEHVGIHDSFFELGGHSLLATRAVSRLREAFGMDLPVSDLFESPTVASVAESIEALRWSLEETPAPGSLAAEGAEDMEEFEL